MARKLAVQTALMDNKGVLHTFSPGDTPPEWAADRIGDHAYEEESTEAPREASDADNDGDASGDTDGDARGTEDGSGDEGGESKAATDFTKPAPKARNKKQ